MRPALGSLFIVPVIFILGSCGGKNKNSPAADSKVPTTGTISIKAVEKKDQPVYTAADSTLEPVRSFIEKGLDKWAHSFSRFNIDSFHMSEASGFEDLDYQGIEIDSLYGLYKAALIYSPDSTQFIDLYSYGLMLEKKGKKIVASADVDNAVTLYDLRAKTWKRITFFGPSAAIEEAVWTSPTDFILAGVGPSNTNDKQNAFIMLGNTKYKTFRWFESKTIRLPSSKYQASGMVKLKIDEWE